MTFITLTAITFMTAHECKYESVIEHDVISAIDKNHAFKGTSHTELWPKCKFTVQSKQQMHKISAINVINTIK